MANWSGLSEAVRLYSEEYLPILVAKDGPFGEGGVWAVFARGTVVPFALDGLLERAEAYVYDPYNDEAWPRYRLVLDSWRAAARKNVRAYRRTLATCPEPLLVKAATMLLMAGGYPPPGADISDSVTAPLVRGLWSTRFPRMPTPSWAPYLQSSIASLALNDVDARTEEQRRSAALASADFGREARRLDYMFPRVAALIKSDLSVTYL